VLSITSILTWDNLINFKIIVLSIVIEALPFVLFSIIVSAILHNFVTENMIRRIIPQNRFLSIVPASLLGILFPVCDCGMVPIVRRLVMKGVPLPTAVSFMLGGPIINPVVTAATVAAFKVNFNMVIFRLGTAFLVACFAGWLTSLFFKGNELKANATYHQHTCGCCEDHMDQPSFTDMLIRTIYVASNEFFDMGKYLVMGAMLGALTQIIISRPLLLSVGQHSYLSIGVMMLFALCVSVCSAADAFIAASFYSSFSAGSLVAFMVFGPMVDLKNTLMLLHAFRVRFVVWLALVIAILCFVAAFLVNHL
jgi:uncharacterized protein